MDRLWWLSRDESVYQRLALALGATFVLLLVWSVRAGRSQYVLGSSLITLLLYCASHFGSPLEMDEQKFKQNLIAYEAGTILLIAYAYVLRTAGPARVLAAFRQLLSVKLIGSLFPLLYCMRSLDSFTGRAPTKANPTLLAKVPYLEVRLYLILMLTFGTVYKCIRWLEQIYRAEAPESLPPPTVGPNNNPLDPNGALAIGSAATEQQRRQLSLQMQHAEAITYLLEHSWSLPANKKDPLIVKLEKFSRKTNVKIWTLN